MVVYKPMGDVAALLYRLCSPHSSIILQSLFIFSRSSYLHSPVHSHPPTLAHLLPSSCQPHGLWLLLPLLCLHYWHFLFLPFGFSLSMIISLSLCKEGGMHGQRYLSTLLPRTCIQSCNSVYSHGSPLPSNFDTFLCLIYFCIFYS